MCFVCFMLETNVEQTAELFFALPKLPDLPDQNTPFIFMYSEVFEFTKPPSMADSICHGLRSVQSNHSKLHVHIISSTIEQVMNTE